MSQDLKIIREELTNFVEIGLPYQFLRDCPIKYITLKNDEEFFYKGGGYIGLGNDTVVIGNSVRTWSVATCYRSKDGSIKYETRFFIPTVGEGEGEIKSIKSKELIKLKETIEYQQSIIEKVSNQLKEIEIQKYSLQENNSEYEELLQTNRYHLKELSIQLRENKKTITKYENIIQKLTQSHPMLK